MLVSNTCLELICCGKPLSRASQVIVLPIFWNMHKEEKAGVMEAAEKVQAVLREGGISVDTDSSNKYTPGQKMKYW